MVLTNKQKDDLHASILGYLRSAGMDKAAAAFAEEAGLEQVDDKFTSLLEKKWTAIVRLQRKVMTLEQANASLQEDLRDYGKGKRVDKTEVLPREPAVHTLQGHRGPVTRVVFHPTYNLLVSASEDTFVRVWDADTGALDGQLRGHTDAVQDVAFNGDGSMLATCSADLSVRVWSFEKRKCVKTLNGHEHNVSSVTWHGTNLFSASRDKTVRLWDTTSGYCTRTFTGHDAWVRCVRVSPDGTLMATASMDQTIKIWNVQTGECVRTLREHDHVVETLEFSDNVRAEDNLRALLAADGGGAAAPAAREEAKDGEAAAAATGAFLVSGSRDKTVRVWEVATGRLVRTMSHDNWVRGVVFHPSGRYILTGADDKSVRVWDLTKNCRLSRTINDAHPLFVSSVAWNKASPMLATGGVDSTVKIWECR